MRGRDAIALRAFAGVFALAAFSGCGMKVTPAPKPPLPSPTPVGLETPAAGSIYLGAYVNTTGSVNEVIAFERTFGRTLGIDGHYNAWTAKFPSGPDDSDAAFGRLPLNSWNCGPTNAQIVSGQADLLIQTRALALKTYGHPVFLRFLWDMNAPASFFGRGTCYDPATDNPDGTFSATQFVAAWQHMRAIFAQEQVTNVIWVWSPNAAFGDPTPYYPGDSQVDWVGVDAYDTTGAGFVATFAPIYPTLVKFNKPILIGETGELPADQASFLSDAGTFLPTQFPQIKGLVYYDSIDTNGTTNGASWLLGTAGTTAFTALGQNPYFTAKGSL